MKKLTAIVLALMLIGLIPAGLADNGYLSLRSMLSMEGALGEPVLTTPFDAEPPLICMLYFDFPNNIVSLMGEDENASPQAVHWVAHPFMMLVLMGAICSNYSMTAELCTNGLTIAWRTSDDEQVSGTVTDEKSAALMVTIIENTLAEAVGSIEASVEGSAE